MIPPGCWPVERRTPTQPWTIRSISQFRLLLASLLIIILHITESRLVRQRTDGSRPEGLAFSENNLRIAVGLTLIVAGEVQVDIRLLVSLKSQEGLKGNIKAVLSSDLRRRPGRPCPACHSRTDPHRPLHHPNQNHNNGIPHSNNEGCRGFTSVIPAMVATKEEPTEPREPTR